MKPFVCIYYQTDTGKQPVKEFIDSLDNRTQHKFFEMVRLLEDKGKTLVRPHADFLRDEIYELRFFGVEGRVRVLYFFYFENKIILTNGFVKKTGPVPIKEIEVARERKRLYVQKNGRLI